MIDFEVAREFVGIGAGATAVLLAQHILYYLWNKKAVARAEEQRFSSALQSADLTTLATYLREDLGAVRVSDYLLDSGIRRKVDTYLGRLAAFVAVPATDDSSRMSPTPPAPASVSTEESVDGANSLLPREGDPKPIVIALATLRDGDIWSALARLRREIEISLRALRARGPNRVLGLGPIHEGGRFSVTTDVPHDAAANLRRFWKVASAAVHGQSISMPEAIEAIADAREVYAAIDRALLRLSAEDGEASSFPLGGAPEN